MIPEQLLYDLLTPAQLDEQTFRGDSLPLASPAIFGGQLMAQVLSAAAATLAEPRSIHYLQTNFIAAGDPAEALDFHVTRLRDGGTTSHRQVLVSQRERPLLTASLSFQKELPGFDHQVAMPKAESPEELLRNSDNILALGEGEDEPFPFTFLQCPVESTDRHPESAVWARLRYDTPSDALTRQMLFSFFSDVSILQSALNPHKLSWGDPSLLVTTMNHSIWFHRPIDLGDWLLYDSESPSTGGGRALSLANAFDRSGNLLATVAQEGVLRQRSA